MQNFRPFPPWVLREIPGTPKFIVWHVVCNWFWVYFVWMFVLFCSVPFCNSMPLNLLVCIFVHVYVLRRLTCVYLSIYQRLRVSHISKYFLRHLNVVSLVWAGASQYSVTLRLQSHAKFGSRRVGLTVNACDLTTILLQNYVHLGVHSDNWDSENIVKNAAYKKVFEETCDKNMMLSVIIYDGSCRICFVMENVLYCMYMYYVVYLTWYSLANVTKSRWWV